LKRFLSTHQNFLLEEVLAAKELIFYVENNTFLSGWWQLKYFLIFNPNFGEDEPNLTHIFQMG